ncbi:hypothetical protein [Camelimonas lactis]|uniref:hypothetical protein n=1 Tax=Camelimonas lactis TaxID=659006 RepID=UPI00104C87C5|nr:hypothetical protein [Camelimonas lactis]
MLDSGILPEGMSGGELKRIYGGLTDDLKTAAERAGGPRGKALFERANNLYSAVSGRREALAKIVGSKGDAPAEAVFDIRVEPVARCRWRPDQTGSPPQGTAAMRSTVALRLSRHMPASCRQRMAHGGS